VAQNYLFTAISFYPNIAILCAKKPLERRRDKLKGKGERRGRDYTKERERKRG